MSEKYRLKIHPAIEFDMDQILELEFNSIGEVGAAKNSCAHLLLFVQDTLGVMGDYSNIFIIEALVDGEWQELDEELIEWT